LDQSTLLKDPWRLQSIGLQRIITPLFPIDLTMLSRSLPLPKLLIFAMLLGCQAESPQVPSQATETAASQEESSSVTESNFQTVESSAEKLVIAVRSPRGIGSGSIQAPSHPAASNASSRQLWPKQVLVQLHLRGLESLTVEAAGIRWEINVSSSPGYSISSRYHGSPEEANQDQAQVYVMPNQQPISHIPLTEGQFFEVLLPAKLFDSDPAEIKLTWIDFYR